MDLRTTTRQTSTTWTSWSEYEGNYYRSVRASSIVVPVVSAVIVLVFAIAFICILYYIRRRRPYEWPRHTPSYATANDTASTTVWSSGGITDMQPDRVMQDLPPPYPGEDLPPAYSVACNMINYNTPVKDDIVREQPKDDINNIQRFCNINPTNVTSYNDQGIAYHMSDLSMYVSNSSTLSTGTSQLELDQASRSRSPGSTEFQSLTDDDCSQHSSAGSADCQHSTSYHHPYGKEPSAGSADCQQSTSYYHPYGKEPSAGSADCQHSTSCHHPYGQESSDERHTFNLTDNTHSTSNHANNAPFVCDQQTSLDSDSISDISESVHGTNESDGHNGSVHQNIGNNNSDVYFV